MYSFKSASLNHLDISIAYPIKNAVHKKIFLNESSPLQQETFNLYIKGSFKLTMPGVIDTVLQDGSTTLSLGDIIWPSNGVLTEIVQSDFGIRYCVSNSTYRQVLHLNNESITCSNKAVFVLTGNITCDNSTYASGAFIWCDNKLVTVNGKVAIVS